jgi:hypothetical protein
MRAESTCCRVGLWCRARLGAHATVCLGSPNRGGLTVFRLAEISLGDLLIHEFEPAFPKLDRTGLELRKSNALNVLRFLGRESMATKRVAVGEPFKSSEFPRVQFNREAEE